MQMWGFMLAENIPDDSRSLFTKQQGKNEPATNPKKLNHANVEVLSYPNTT